MMTSALLPLSLLLALLVTTGAGQTNFCAISSCQNVLKHVLCLYTSSGAASGCGKVLQRGVTATEQTTILNGHNTIRQAVKRGDYASNNLPAASVMPDLTWSDRLAKMAQRWADQCMGGNDKCRDVPRFRVRQLGLVAQKLPSSVKDWPGDTYNNWFHGRLQFFTQTNLTYDSGNSNTYFLTQVIWGATTEIGCGYIETEGSGSNQGLNRHAYICNYGPAGNNQGQLIYQAVPDPWDQ